MYFGGSLFGHHHSTLNKLFARAEKVALSLVLLGLLPPKAFGAQPCGVPRSIATRGSPCPVFGEVLGSGISCRGFVQV